MDIEYWELIAKKINDELTFEEEKKFVDWLNSDVKNQLLLKEAEHIWKVSGSLKNSFEPNTEAAWLKLKEQVESSANVKKINFGRSRWLKIAATIVATIMLGFLVKYIVTTKELLQPLIVEVITKDTVKTFYLPDSSCITLNKNSRFTYPENFRDSIRLVSLIGEAFFDVTPNTNQPFIINAGKTETRVVGTSFNIRAYEEEQNIKVNVVTGKVRVKVKEQNQTVIMEPGEEVIYDKMDVSITKKISKNTDFLRWKEFEFKKVIKHNINTIQKEFKNVKK